MPHPRRQGRQGAYAHSPRFQGQMKAAGNTCDLITIPGGGHGMGGWDKLGGDYAKQMIGWLRKSPFIISSPLTPRR